MRKNRGKRVAAGPALAACWLMALGPVLVQGSERKPITWQSDVQAAWKLTRQEGRPLLVFVTAPNCFYCTKMKQATYADPTVAAAVNRAFVPLVLDAASADPLLKDLGVTAFPATFLISSEAVVLARMDGYLGPEKLIARLTAAQVRPPPREF